MQRRNYILSVKYQSGYAFLATAAIIPNATYSWYLDDNLQPEVGYTCNEYVTCNTTYILNVFATTSCGTSQHHSSNSINIKCGSVGASVINSNLVAGETDSKNIPVSSVFPNPAHTILYIILPADSIDIPHANIVISDMGGRVLQQLASVAQSNSIDIAKFAAGTYIVEINDGKRKIIKKVIKN